MRTPLALASYQSLKSGERPRRVGPLKRIRTPQVLQVPRTTPPESRSSPQRACRGQTQRVSFPDRRCSLPKCSAVFPCATRCPGPRPRPSPPSMTETAPGVASAAAAVDARRANPHAPDLLPKLLCHCLTCIGDASDCTVPRSCASARAALLSAIAADAAVGGPTPALNSPQQAASQAGELLMRGLSAMPMQVRGSAKLLQCARRACRTTLTPAPAPRTAAASPTASERAARVFYAFERVGGSRPWSA